MNNGVKKTLEIEEVDEARMEVYKKGEVMFLSEKEMKWIEEHYGEGKPFTPKEAEDLVQALKKGTLSSFFQVLEQYFEVKDRIGFTIVLATAIAHHVPGEMLWMRIYGASRSGKTALLKAIAEHESSVEMEAITPASIRGGLKGGHRLLERINGKLVITKDFATILTARREIRTETFGLLRNVKDGQLTADFGTEEGYIEQKVKFDWLIGTTPVFAQYRQMEDLLGARYVDLHWQTGKREEMAFLAAQNNPKMAEVRIAIACEVIDLIDKARLRQQMVPETLGEEDIRFISDWADLTAWLRTPVARDFQHRIKFHSEPEVGTDLAQSFTRIAIGLKLLDEDNYEPYIARLAHDSIPYSRRQVIRELLEGATEDFVESTGSVGTYELPDLGELGVTKKKNNKWQIVPKLQGRIARLANYWTP